MTKKITIRIHDAKAKDAPNEVPARLDKVIRELQGWIQDIEQLKRAADDTDITPQEVERYLAHVKRARDVQIG